MQIQCLQIEHKRWKVSWGLQCTMTELCTNSIPQTRHKEFSSFKKKKLNYYHNNRTVPITFQLSLQFSQIFYEFFKLDLGSQKEILWFRQRENTLFCSCFLKDTVNKSAFYFPVVTFNWNSKAPCTGCAPKSQRSAPLLLLTLDWLLRNAFVSSAIALWSYCHWGWLWLWHRVPSILPHEPKRKLSGMSRSWTPYSHGKRHRRNTRKYLNFKSLFELHMGAIS